MGLDNSYAVIRYFVEYNIYNLNSFKCRSFGNIKDQLDYVKLLKKSIIIMNIGYYSKTVYHSKLSDRIDKEIRDYCLKCD